MLGAARVAVHYYSTDGDNRHSNAYKHCRPQQVLRGGDALLYPLCRAEWFVDVDEYDGDKLSRNLKFISVCWKRKA